MDQAHRGEAKDHGEQAMATTAVGNSDATKVIHWAFLLEEIAGMG